MGRPASGSSSEMIVYASSRRGDPVSGKATREVPSRELSCTGRLGGKIASPLRDWWQVAAHSVLS